MMNVIGYIFRVKRRLLSETAGGRSWQGNSNAIRNLFDTYVYGSEANSNSSARYSVRLKRMVIIRSFRNESGVWSRRKKEQKFPAEESDMKEIPELQLYQLKAQWKQKRNEIGIFNWSRAALSVLPQNYMQ